MFGKRFTSILVAIIAICLGIGYFYAHSYFPNVWSMLKWTITGGNDGREEKCLSYVRQFALFGNPDSVLKAIDQFGWNQEWLMNVGDDKGLVLSDEVKKKQPKRALEIGAFVGYSAIRIASLLPNDGHLTSVELNPKNAAIARQMVDYAGLSDKVTILEGTVSTVLLDYMRSNNLPGFDFVFIDHWKDAYLPDLQFLLQHSMIEKHGIVVADNILFPGAPDYRQYVNTDARFKSIEYVRKLEYSNVEDIIMVSEFLG